MLHDCKSNNNNKTDEKGWINLSTITLSKEELVVLKYGLKHPIHPLHVNKTDVLTTFDFILRIMTKDQVQRFLRSMKDKKIFTKERYEKIYHSSSKPAFIYGAPKVRT